MEFSFFCSTSLDEVSLDLVNFFERLFRNMIMCLRLVGMLFRYAFVKVVFLAIFRNFAFHPASLEWRLSITVGRSFTDNLLWIIGYLKYFPKHLLLLICNVSTIWLSVSIGQFFEKIIFDFEKFIVWLES